jgi:gamma-glutamylcyclotransferase (GGCT)/AIG2-like uncharacterized protein YtfP
MNRTFVYGTLLSGEPNHAQLGGARLLGPARTESRYMLVSLGPYPALLEGGTTSVVGEVYEVDDDLLAALDRFEGRPHLYQRTLVQLVGGESAHGYVLARAAQPRYPVIKGGDWREYRCASRW